MTELVSAVLSAADQRRDAPAISSRGQTLSFGALADRVRGVAAALAAEGLAPGERVLFSVRPGPDAVVLALAVVHAGGTVVFADPGAGAALMRARAALAAPGWLAAESLLHLASSPLVRPLARRRGLELPPYGRLVPGARHLVAGPRLPGTPRGALRLDALLRRSAPTGWHPPAVDLDAPALVIFTSGTTEAPKAVVHSRGSLGAGFTDFAAALRLRAGQRVLTDQLMIGVPALIAGARWTLPPPGLDPGARPEQYLAALPATDVLFASPAALDAILRRLDAAPAATPHLEVLALGGAPVLPPLLRRARARFPDAAIRSVYGMTEILPVAIADGDDKLRHAGPGDLVGPTVPSVHARIVDDELVLSGPGLALGYLGEWPQHPLRELRTGDLARIETGPDGERLVLLGRRKDMFIRGTQNVYPGLYEPLIAGLPGVGEALLVGVPDAIGDDRLVLAVVPAESPPATPMTEHPVAVAVRRALPGLMDAGALPDVVVAVPSVPRSGRGAKPDRAALAADLAGLLP